MICWGVFSPRATRAPLLRLLARASFIPFLARPGPDVFLTYPGLCHPFLSLHKNPLSLCIGILSLCIKNRPFDVSRILPLSPAFPTPWPGKSNVAPPGQGALCPTGLHEQRKAKRQLPPKPAGQGRRNWDRSEAESPSPRPSGGLLLMRKKRPRRAFGSGGFLVVN